MSGQPEQSLIHYAYNIYLFPEDLLSCYAFIIEEYVHEHVGLTLIVSHFWLIIIYYLPLQCEKLLIIPNKMTYVIISLNCYIQNQCSEHCIPLLILK